ncbi:hypothetical protein CEXT_262681 [Caerostris extrusa]|uniref:Uncharacterized protein n=1 Tax=Caerostris extrusa TaxID=172846 RepID=A0AAV4QXH6_CAEEX|nr:hypothetical protein CEXT_262681 [Caerostris extrusa]
MGPQPTSTTYTYGDHPTNYKPTVIIKILEFFTPLKLFGSSELITPEIFTPTPRLRTQSRSPKCKRKSSPFQITPAAFPQIETCTSGIRNNLAYLRNTGCNTRLELKCFSAASPSLFTQTLGFQHGMHKRNLLSRWKAFAGAGHSGLVPE